MLKVDDVVLHLSRSERNSTIQGTIKRPVGYWAVVPAWDLSVTWECDFRARTNVWTEKKMQQKLWPQSLHCTVIVYKWNNTVGKACCFAFMFGLTVFFLDRLEKLVCWWLFTHHPAFYLFTAHSVCSKSYEKTHKISWSNNIGGEWQSETND